MSNYFQIAFIQLVTHPQAEARVASGRNKLIERQSEVYIERLAARCQVHYRRSIIQVD